MTDTNGCERLSTDLGWVSRESPISALLMQRFVEQIIIGATDLTHAPYDL